MYEKAPDDIEVVFPMKSGVIARFDNMQTLLGALLRTKKRSVWGSEYVVAVPTDVTEVEKSFLRLGSAFRGKSKISPYCRKRTG